MFRLGPERLVGRLIPDPLVDARDLAVDEPNLVDQPSFEASRLDKTHVAGSRTLHAMASLVPYLTFRNGDDSLRFLTDGLGFEVVTQQRGDDGGIVHVELTRGDAVLMGGADDLPAGESPGLYLVVDDVDDTFGRLTSHGAEVVYGPETTEWGTARARVRDLDGHEWTVGTYQPGQSWG